MRIAGFVKTSFVDFPQKIAAVVFTEGCNLNCFYCHNRHIISGSSETGSYAPEVIFAFLAKRRHICEAVVISGGEPTLQGDLAPFIKQIKKLGYQVKLDTNGTQPDVLAELVREKLVDYIAMDLKAPFVKYNLICGCEVDCPKIQESIGLLKKSAVPHEYRTTLCSGLTPEDLQEIACVVAEDKGCKYVVQRCRNVEGLSENLGADEERWRSFFLFKIGGELGNSFETRGFLSGRLSL
jgi:pyruvate formate lyase activating enzyme